MFDRPSTELVRNLYLPSAKKAGYTELTVVQHFTTYLVVKNELVYRIGWKSTATWTAGANPELVGPTYALDGNPQGAPLQFTAGEAAAFKDRFPNVQLK